MSCAQFEERIARYVGGDPDAELEQHLRACPDCAALARDLEADREWLASHPPQTADVDFVEMRREIRWEIARPRHGWKRLAIAAAILLAVGLATMPRKAAVKPERPGQPPVASAGMNPGTTEAPRHVKPKRTPSPPAVRSDSQVRIELATGDPNITIILLPELKGDTQ